MTSKAKQKKEASSEKEYRSLTGHNFVNVETGEENRVEPGEKIVGMEESSLRHEISDGKVEEFIPYDTDNVEEVEPTDLTGTRTRREGGELTTREVKN